MQFVVKLFPEITIKSPPVRKRFTRQLRENLKTLTAELPFDVRIVREWDRLDIFADPETPEQVQQLEVILASTPGIAHVDVVESFSFATLDDVVEQVVPIWAKQVEGKTFCVRVKRTGEHGFSSIDAERVLGSHLNRGSNAAGVNLKQPDITFRVDIKDQRAFIVERQLAGLGGFPMGTQEPVLSLISGGFDSTVASFDMIRRGVRTHFCFFRLGGAAHEVGVKEVAYFLWQKYARSHKALFITIPFEDVVTEILEKVDNRYMGVILKRMMLRAAAAMAEELNVPALVTGEAIAQVSSQTLTNLAIIDRVTDHLVLRPLAARGKGEIIQSVRAMGAEELVASIPEYCGVISRKPTTRAKAYRVEGEEARFDFSILDAAIQGREFNSIENLRPSPELAESVSVSPVIAPGQVVIDVRHPTETELRPLGDVGAEIIMIPFYQLPTKFSGLDANTHYLLYCDKGVLSQLQAANLWDAGHRNVSVWRPE